MDVLHTGSISHMQEMMYVITWQVCQAMIQIDETYFVIDIE